MTTGHLLDFDVAQLGEWLAEQTGQNAALRVEPITGGGSCELFKVSRLGEEWIMRRAPADAVSDTAHDVVREYQFYQALQNSDVPIPQLLAVCTDPVVTGARFFIMKLIDGVVLRRALPEPYLADPPAQVRIGEQLIDVLAALHDFDWQSSDLTELARHDRFLERQVDRWMHQLEAYRCRDMPGVDDVAHWLESHRPASNDLAIMHGDYKLDNVIFSNDCPPTILSVLDFEMATIGDPLIDLSWAMIFWPAEGNMLAFAAPGVEGGMDAEHCQSASQLIERYGERTGRDLSNLQWYDAFSAWKLAIVLEASYAKHLSGRSKNPIHQYFGGVVDHLLARARTFAE
jgi:aminoglycoside phosphotransferase (APT) family kinase protein